MYDKDIPSVSEELVSDISDIDNENRCISATGAHGLVLSKKDEEFKKILQSFYINLPDGMPGVWVGRWKGAKKMQRCYGPDFFEYFMRKTANNSEVKHFLCGGKDGVAKKLAETCEKKFGNRNISGFLTPPFLDVKDYDYEYIAKEISSSGANFVWIGLSTPKQEQFASFLRKYSSVKYIVTVGAAFDFHIGNVRQAPNLLQKMGLEWFFRLLMEPKRLWKRYIEIVPSFLYFIFAHELRRGK